MGPRPTLEQLENNIHSLLSKSLAPSTTRNYNSAFNRYLLFCETHNLQAAPLHEYNLMLFVSSMSHTSISNIKIRLAAIKHYVILLHYHSQLPTLPQLYMLTHAIKRIPGNNKRLPRSPITAPLLHQLRNYITDSSLNITNQTMLWPAFMTAFFGFLRSSEYVSPTINKFDAETTLLCSDINISHHRVLINIKASKTDPFRHGCSICLAPTNSPLCPTIAIINYLNIHPTNTGPFFTYLDGSYLTRRRLNKIIKSAIPTTDPVSSHSFCIGAATTATAAGFPQWLIQQLGRWNSDCFCTYICIPNSTIDQVCTLLTGHYNISNNWNPNLSL